MKNIKKISIVGAVTGSVLVADNVFDVFTNNAIAQVADDNKKVDPKKRGGSLTAILNLWLNGSSLQGDQYLTEQDTVLTVDALTGVLSNDQLDSSESIEILQDVTNGTLLLNSDGSFTYTPNLGFIGNDRFIYRLSDSNDLNNQATVNIKVNGIPNAVDDDFLLSDRELFSDNVITNIIGGSDIIVDGATVEPVVDVDTVLGGKVSIQANGDFQYTPPASLGSQQDSFVYTLRDSDGETDTATITWQLNASINGVDSAESVSEDEVLNSEFTLFSPNGIEYLEINGTEFSLQALNGASAAVPLQLSNEMLGEFTITNFNSATGVVSYQYDPAGDRQNHSNAVENALEETLSLKLKDTDFSETVDATLLISVVDTNPTAVDDNRAISEGTSAIAGNSVGSVGAAIGDNVDSSADPISLTGISVGASNGVVGTTLSANYGSFIIDAAGIYTYTLDNTNPTVEGLKANQSLSETFTYTVTDDEAPNADSDSANIIVTINGVEDAAPVLTFNGTASAGGNFLYTAAENVGFPAGQITLEAESGLNAFGAALQVQIPSGDIVSLSLSQIQGLNANAIIIPATIGSLQLNAFNQLGSTITIGFAYSVSGVPGSFDHSTNDPAQEFFDFTLTDNEGDVANTTVEFRLTDTAPSAAPDTNSILEKSSTSISGDVIAGTISAGIGVGGADTQSADTAASVSQVSFMAASKTVGTAFDSNYGSLDLNADGSYTYTLKNDGSEPVLLNGESLTEIFEYSIVDSDGDIATTTLTITINGINEPPVITIPNDGLGAAGSDVSVLENVTGAGTFNVKAEVGLNATGTALSVVDQSTPTNNLDISLAQLQALSTSNLTINATNGVLSLTSYNGTSGDVSYSYDPNGSSQDHSGGDTSIIDTFRLTATDADNMASVSADLNILVADSTPDAMNDSRTISEGTSAIAGNAVGTTGAASGDVQDTSIDPVSVTDIDFGVTDGTIGSTLAGNYGSFVINSAGVYTYTLDNTNSSVQGLKANEFLNETFTYTITDNESPNADSDSADVTIRIDGVDDAAPTIMFNTSGSNGDFLYSAAENVGFSAGTMSVQASAGLNGSGTALEIQPQGGPAVSLTLAQVQAISSSNPLTIAATYGSLVLNSYNSSGSQVTLGFVFSVPGVPGSFNHSITDPAQDIYSLTLTDNEGDVANANVEFRLTDTAPTAAADSVAIDEDSFGAVGDVISGTTSVGVGSGGADTQGADTAVSLSQVSFMAVSQTVGSAFNSSYGSLDLNADGTYTYTLNNSNASVQALKTGEMLTEIFDYTIVDTDGDESSTTLTVTINGVDETPFITIPNDGLGVASTDISVVENEVVSGTFNINAESGLRPSGTALTVEVNTADTNITLAQLQDLATSNITISNPQGSLSLIDYDSSTGDVSYSYDPFGTSQDHSSGDNSRIETFILSVVDANNISSPSMNLDILIADTAPIAIDDSDDISEGTLAISGNVISGGIGEMSDTVVDPVSVTDIDFGVTDGVVGSALAGNYGSFVISSTGVYTYTLDNANSDVQNLNFGDTLIEVFTYTITDNESPNADIDTGDLTVTIYGVTN